MAQYIDMANGSRVMRYRGVEYSLYVTDTIATICTQLANVYERAVPPQAQCTTMASEVCNTKDKVINAAIGKFRDNFSLLCNNGIYN